VKIYLIRHGKDDETYRGGWSPLGLVKEGEDQAYKLAIFLKQNKDKYPISKIVASDLRRSLETAKFISKELGLDVISSKEWREMNNGDLAGMLNSDALEKHPGLFFNTLKMDEKFPNGESPIEFFKRIENSFKSIINNSLNNNLAIFTHAGVINIIYSIVKGIEWSNKEQSFRIQYTSMHVLNVSNNKCEFIEENLINHLNAFK
jgi:probable phosphoglycerate mutase